MDAGTIAMIQEILAVLEKEDLVSGKWHVSNSKTGVVLCDASSIVIGVVIKIHGVVAEDTAWLRKKMIITISIWLS